VDVSGAPARLVVVESGHSLPAITLQPGESILVGRDPQARIRLTDTRASRRHLTIDREGAGWVVRDLGGTNGTRVVDSTGTTRELRGSVIRLTSGQLLVGDALLTLYPGDNAARPAVQSFAPVPPPIAYAPQPIATGAHNQSRTGQPGAMSGEARRARLARQVSSMVATQGARVESQSDFQAVLVTGQPVNHVLHFLIGVFTCGLWWIIWLILALTGGARRALIQVDEWGNVTVQRV
jgi:hypothetical protein